MITYKIILAGKAKEHILKHRKSGNIMALKKINALLLEIEIHPRSGSGQIEQLKYFKKETWSRRINQEHRLVYSIDDEKITVTIISAHGHYSAK